VCGEVPPKKRLGLAVAMFDWLKRAVTVAGRIEMQIGA
jgi:hypothetical protein